MNAMELELNKAAAAVTLTPAARRVHRAVVTIFAETGRPPTRTSLARLARDQGADPERVLAEMAELDVVVFDDRGEIRAAYPFSPAPTAIRVVWAGGPAVFAMCAIDALGVSAMLDRPVIITAAEPDTGAAITVRVDHDTARWTPESAVVFASSSGDACCPSADRTCGHINFFTSDQAALAWAARHPELSGAALDQANALAYGVAEFSTLLHDPAAS